MTDEVQRYWDEERGQWTVSERDYIELLERKDALLQTVYAEISSMQRELNEFLEQHA